WNPATQFVCEITPRYRPPSIPVEAALKTTSPCCSTQAAPSSTLSTKLTVVAPSPPFPPATCSFPLLTLTAEPGSATDQRVGSSVVPAYSSFRIVLLNFVNGVCER